MTAVSNGFEARPVCEPSSEAPTPTRRHLGRQSRVTEAGPLPRRAPLVTAGPPTLCGRLCPAGQGDEELQLPSQAPAPASNGNAALKLKHPPCWRHPNSQHERRSSSARSQNCSTASLLCSLQGEGTLEKLRPIPR